MTMPATTHHPQSDSARASIPIPPSCAWATTTTSPPPPSSGIPGVQIHHSRDLVHWRLLTRPLRRASQLNMLGDPDSCGIWAPCLTYDDGLLLPDLHRRQALRPHHSSAPARAPSLRDLAQLPGHLPDHRRRVVRPRLSEQQRLRSVAVPRRRRPQVPASTCSGTTGRAATVSPASCCRSTPTERRSLIGERSLIFQGTADRLHRRRRTSTSGTATTTCSPPKAARAGDTP